MDSVFRMPAHGETYINSIKERCFNLIELNIWEGIEKNQVKKWLTNFSSEEELYFAACILDCLIYRSESQTESLLSQLFYKEIPNLIYLNRLNLTENILDKLKSFQEPGIRLVSVMMGDDSPIKSSAIIGRILKRAYGLNQKYFIRPVDIKPCFEIGVRQFIFLDDFLGTGDQFTGMIYEILHTYKYEKCIDESTIIYAPLVAHIKGIQAIKSSFPNIHVTQAELLDQSHALFTQCFDDGVNSPDGAKNFYLEMLKKKGLEQSIDKQFGYGNYELTYAFSHGIPDNSLGILYFNENGWNPLINR